MSLERRITRVRRMSRAEVRSRVVSLARRRLGWLAPDAREEGWVARVLADQTLRAELPAYLARVLRSRIYGVDWTPAHLAANLTAAGATDRVVAEADEVRAHRLRVLGYGVRDAGTTIDWHRDLVSEARWPQRYWGWMTRGIAQGWD